MTEIPDHLLKRAQAASDKIPQHLQQRAQATNYSDRAWIRDLDADVSKILERLDAIEARLEADTQKTGSSEALDMVLESAAKIAAWHQNLATGPPQNPGLGELVDLARDMYASYATYLYTKDTP